MNYYVKIKLGNLIKNFSYFLCLDKNTDISTNQFLNFIRIVQSDFTVNKKLSDICKLQNV